MTNINPDASVGNNINAISEVAAPTRMDKYNNDYEYSKLLVDKAESLAKDGLKQVTTNVSQESSQELDTLIENNKKNIIQKINIPVISAKHLLPNSYYVELKEYNGRVLNIDQTNQKFTAELINISDDKEILEAEFDVSDIDRGDESLFREGALFVWKIGKEENNGTQQKISQIVFRRLASWRATDIKRTEEIAKSRAAAIRAISGKDSSTEQ